MTEPDFPGELFTLRDRVALVTGASSGIGAHLSRTLARAGCQVVLTARRQEKLVALAEDITAQGGQALAITMDVTDRDSVEQAFAEAVERTGRLDVLVNNAGVADSQWFLKMTEQAWSDVLETNLSAVWRVAQVAARLMAAGGEGGSIINIASVLGFVPQRTQTNYGAAKAGVIQLTRNMALELCRNAIRVNAIAPGYFATEMNADFLGSDKGQAYLDGLVPRRPGRLEELDGAVLLLASGAGSYINGAVIPVDGGTVLGNI